tara:strand:+ start:487 stop:717 length:231 start_codon:yes stop_codon:yes gene_type:complete
MRSVSLTVKGKTSLGLLVFNLNIDQPLRGGGRAGGRRGSRLILVAVDIVSASRLKPRFAADDEAQGTNQPPRRVFV